MTIRSLESKKFSGEANSPQAPPGEQVAQSQANQNTNVRSSKNSCCYLNIPLNNDVTALFRPRAQPKRWSEVQPRYLHSQPCFPQVLPSLEMANGDENLSGSINIHYMSGFVIGNGSFVMNGKVANDDFHLEKHSQQNDQIPTGSSDSSDKQTSTVSIVLPLYLGRLTNFYFIPGSRYEK